MRPERAIESAAEVVGAKALLTSCSVTLGIGKRHGRMAAKRELVATGLEDAVPTVHQVENLPQFGRDVCHGITIEPA